MRKIGVRFRIKAFLAASAAAGPAMAKAPEDAPLVAIIDSGIASTWELYPLLVGEYDLGTKRARDAFKPRYDHGTMVATILARATDRKVRILSFRIDDEAGCPASATPPCQQNAKRIEKAIRIATRAKVDAINISLTLSDDPGIVDAIHDASAKGITVVLAAGNDGRDRPGNLQSARAAFPKAVLVGAVDRDGQVWTGTNRPDLHPAGYAYSWQWGVDVPTALADGRAAIATGTSFAAPIETARRLKAQRQQVAKATRLRWPFG